MKSYMLALAAFLFSGCVSAQGLNPSEILHPTPQLWPTYNGDYSGRRFSDLKQINRDSLKDLQLAWLYQANTGPGDASPFGIQIKATPLEVGGVLYFTVPDHAWAVDARTGRQIWHYKWESKGGIHIGNRGVGIYLSLIHI